MRVALCSLLLACPIHAQELPDHSGALFRCYQAAADTDARRACKDSVARLCMAEEGGETTIGMSSCLQAETEAWDVLLNSEYRETMAYMKALDEDDMEYFPGFAGRAQALLDAQRAWLAFRDAECELAYAEWGSGSHRHVAGSACYAEMTADRTIDLRSRREAFE